LEEISRFERIEAAVNLKEADRVPVDPLNIYIHAYQGGTNLREFIYDPVKMVQATERARKILGETDQVYPTMTAMNHLSLIPIAAFDQYTLRWEIFDEFPPKGNIPSFYEKKIIEDYDDVMERGFSTLLFNRKIGKRTLQMSEDEILYYAFEYPKLFAKEWRGFVERNKVPLTIGARACVPLDMVFYYRGMTQATRDLHECPSKVKEFCEWIIEHEVTVAKRHSHIMGAGEVPGADRILYGAGIVGIPFLSPEMFDEFFYPTMKNGLDMIVKAGFTAHCHWDNDITLNLETLRGLSKGLPKGKIILDMGQTDMAKAKEILGDKICLYGNVPSSLLIHGSVKEVKTYCKKLIEDCMDGGGFILSTECETPWNAKPENVRAMLDSVRQFGKYK
jgi:hypothetical protein